MKSNHTFDFGWAELDAANRTHYASKERRDRELIDAERDLEDADAEYDRVCNDYYDNHYEDQEYLELVRLARATVEAAAERVNILNKQK